MKTVYTYNSDDLLDNDKTRVVDDNYELATNETFIAPTGMYEPIKFSDGQWIGSSKEDFLKSNPEKSAPIDPNYVDLSSKISSTALLVAQREKANSIITSKILLEIADLKTGGKD